MSSDLLTFRLLSLRITWKYNHREALNPSQKVLATTCNRLWKKKLKQNMPLKNRTVSLTLSRFKDGNKVIPSTKYELLNFHDDIFSLLIKKVKDDDSGRYTCVAKNEYGEAKSEALLNVVGELVSVLLMSWCQCCW